VGTRVWIQSFLHQISLGIHQLRYGGSLSRASLCPRAKSQNGFQGFFKSYEKPQFFLELMGPCIKCFQTIYYGYIMVQLMV